jgi:hypothetical protein
MLFLSQSLLFLSFLQAVTVEQPRKLTSLVMEYNSPYIQLRMENQILQVSYVKNLQINLPIALDIVKTRRSFTNGRLIPVMIFSKGLVSIDKPAREFLASPEGVDGLSAAAIIVQSPFASFLGNFFLTVNKTGIPVKIFSNQIRAEKWLRKFIDKS